MHTPYTLSDYSAHGLASRSSLPPSTARFIHYHQTSFQPTHCACGTPLADLNRRTSSVSPPRGQRPTRPRYHSTYHFGLPRQQPSETPRAEAAPRRRPVIQPVARPGFPTATSLRALGSQYPSLRVERPAGHAAFSHRCPLPAQLPTPVSLVSCPSPLLDTPPSPRPSPPTLFHPA